MPNSVISTLTVPVEVGGVIQNVTYDIKDNTKENYDLSIGSLYDYDKKDKHFLHFFAVFATAAEKLIQRYFFSAVCILKNQKF